MSDAANDPVVAYAHGRDFGFLVGAKRFLDGDLREQEFHAVAEAYEKRWNEQAPVLKRDA